MPKGLKEILSWFFRRAEKLKKYKKLALIFDFEAVDLVQRPFFSFKTEPYANDTYLKITFLNVTKTLFSSIDMCNVIIAISLLMSPLLGNMPPYGTHITGYNPLCGPSANWWVLTVANVAGTTGLACIPLYGARDSKFWLQIRWPTNVASLLRSHAELSDREAIELLYNFVCIYT
jgi:hypothetical protein